MSDMRDNRKESLRQSNEGVGLRPCPFCNSGEVQRVFMQTGLTVITCRRCHAKGPETEVTWNDRRGSDE